MRPLGRLRTVEYRIKLHIRHIGLGNIGYMTPGTLAHWGFRSSLRIWQGVMAKGEVTPPVAVRETFAVLYRDIHSIELAVKIPSAGRFLSRAIGKSGV